MTANAKLLAAMIQPTELVVRSDETRSFAVAGVRFDPSFKFSGKLRFIELASHGMGPGQFDADRNIEWSDLGDLLVERQEGQVKLRPREDTSPTFGYRRIFF